MGGCGVLTKRINNILYNISIMRNSLHACKNHVIRQSTIIEHLFAKRVITKAQFIRAKEAINNWKWHRSHADVSVIQINLDTNEVKTFNLNITSKDKKVLIVKSLSESALGIQDETHEVIKINDNLYITSHSLIPDVNLTEIPYGELKYDPVKDMHVDIDPISSKITEFSNLTKANVEKMSEIIINHIESAEVKKVDIATTADIFNDVAVLKYLQEFQKDTFEKVTYEDIGLEMEKIDKKVMQTENYIKSLIDKDAL